MAVLINDTSALVVYTATAGQTVFAVPFEFFDAEDIVVEVDGAALTYSVSPADATQYSVSGANVEGGGAITIGGAGVTLGARVLIYRDIPINRRANYPLTGPMAISSLNQEQARHVAIMQQLRDRINEALRVAIGSSNFMVGSISEGDVLSLVDGEIVGISPADLGADILEIAAALTGPIFADTIAGIAGTNNGDFFAVNNAGVVTIYLNDNGVAVAQRDFVTATRLASATGSTLVGFGDSTVAEQIADINSIRFYGYRGDGQSHPLSTVTFFKGQDTTGWTLSQWQAAVPQVTGLANEIDSIAVQAWFNDRPNGGQLHLPAGLSIWNTTINTGLNQAVEIRGAGQGVTEIEWRATGTLWKHGFVGATGANFHFYAHDFRVTPNADTASECCFNVRFSGAQAPWCHVISNVCVLARDTDSWFTNVTITRNFKRGVDWRNFIVFGRNFFILSTDAHVFPSNVASDPDTPPGQIDTDAGDSTNFDNCMAVGYRWGWYYDWTGWTDVEHSHEQGRWANSQVYSGLGFASLVNTNDAYAPGDNWIFEVPGWQGIGPAFDIRWQEHVRCYDGLFVPDATSVNDITRIAQLIDCKDTTFEGNEIFTEGTWTGGNMFAIGGNRTRGIYLEKNAIVHFATSMAQWLFVNGNVPARQVIERDNVFAGPGAYSAAKVTDASNGAISETRVKDIVEALPGSNWSWDVGADGSITYRNVHLGDTDNTGRITVTLPTGLFRSFCSATATNGFDIINSPIAIGTTTASAVTFRYTALSAVTPVGFYFEVVGR